MKYEQCRDNIILTVGLFLLFIPLIQCNYFQNTVQSNGQCFCKLIGSIDDCDCNVDTVDYFNNIKIYPKLKSLLLRSYFRFYKVNLKTKCPFWPDDGQCAIRFCHVQPCQDEDIPIGLKGELPELLHKYEKPVEKYLQDTQLSNCENTARDHDKELGYLNTTISSENYKEFEKWQQYDDAQDNFCVEETNAGEYVDLSLNPERFTGYKGSSAHRIWRSIYMENCFRPENSPQNLIQSSQLNGMCLEKRAFYRVISGLHASINIHLSAKYLLSNKKALNFVDNTVQWGPNLEEFHSRFSPEYTGNEGPNWLRNLYFLYLLELRALNKAAPYLEREEYYTGNEVEDIHTRTAVNDILQTIKSFPNHFNESGMFNGGSEALILKEEFRQHFRNISRIMDCVGCEKCKLWGKLQIQGLGTALKILFSGKFDQWTPTLNNFSRRHFYLDRSEIVALINGFGKLSESIFELDKFRKMMK